MVLFVSRDNPGAAEVAAEMHSRFKGISVTTALLRAAGSKTLSGSSSRKFIFHSRRFNSGSASRWLPRAASEAAQTMRSTAKSAKGNHQRHLDQHLTRREEAMRSMLARRNGAEPTHFLLYLSRNTFQGKAGDALAEQLRRAN